MRAHGFTCMLNLETREIFHLKSIMSSLQSKKGKGLEVYCKDGVLRPPGIKNLSYNCYANCIIQCMLNMSCFPTIAQELLAIHPDDCGSMCCQTSRCFYPQKKTKVLFILSTALIVGPICSVRAIIMMVNDYKFSKLSKTISPHPILTALPGTCTIIINYYDCK